MKDMVSRLRGHGRLNQARVVVLDIAGARATSAQYPLVGKALDRPMFASTSRPERSKDGHKVLSWKRSTETVDNSVEKIDYRPQSPAFS
jgi:hypothetical protein